MIFALSAEEIAFMVIEADRQFDQWNLLWQMVRSQMIFFQKFHYAHYMLYNKES